MQIRVIWKYQVEEEEEEEAIEVQSKDQNFQGVFTIKIQEKCSFSCAVTL